MIWSDIEPADAVNIDCRERPDLLPPLNEAGEPCPWPWEPQGLSGVPLGQYHCGHCGAMCLAGIPHLDYRPMLAAGQLMIRIGWEESDTEFAMRMIELARYVSERSPGIPVVTTAENKQVVGIRYLEGQWQQI